MNTKKIVVKISTPDSDSSFPILRQLSGNNIFNDFIFEVNSDISECDYWFVYENLSKQEHCKCNPANVVLYTGEPPTMKYYNHEFLSQFGKVISCHMKIGHRNAVFSFTPLLWLVGVRFDRVNKKWINTGFMTYKDFESFDYTYQKTKQLSVMSSRKGFTAGHRNRVKFIDQLKERLGDKVDVFGRGYNEIEDKFDALRDYRYSLVIENSRCTHYWTEKLSDAFLSNCFPLYYGCPNIYDYFDRDSLIEIDIHASTAIDQIERIIRNDYDIQFRDKLEEAKMLVLNKYNLFNQIVEVVENSRENLNEKREVCLNPIYYGIYSKFRNRLLRL